MGRLECLASAFDLLLVFDASDGCNGGRTSQLLGPTERFVAKTAVPSPFPRERTKTDHAAANACAGETDSSIFMRPALVITGNDGL